MSLHLDVDLQQTAPMALDELPGASTARTPTLGDMLIGSKLVFA